MNEEIKGVTTNDIENIQVQLNLKDGRILLGVTDHPIINKICRGKAGIDTRCQIKGYSEIIMEVFLMGI